MVINMHEITVPAKVEHLDKVFSFIEKSVSEANMDKKYGNNLRIAVEEIFVNIADYAYSHNDGDVTISVSVSSSNITVEFKDKGIKFNPLEKDDPDTTLSADEREIGGLGIFMVKELVDDISYRYEDGSNILTIVIS